MGGIAALSGEYPLREKEPMAGTLYSKRRLELYDGVWAQRPLQTLS
jgi:hypothetical protein